MDRILIVGSSGHAKVVIDVVEKAGKYEIVGLLDRYRKVGEDTFGYKVLGQEEDLARLRVSLGLSGIFVAIGDNFSRELVTRRVVEYCPGLALVSLVHPDASIGKGVSIGDGTVVMAGAVINPSCEIGRSCIINTSSSIDHDSVMGDYSSLAPGAVTGGRCRIGNFSAICIGATLIQGIHVGEHSLVGAGAVVLDNIGPGTVAAGVPARPLRTRTPGERYV